MKNLEKSKLRIEIFDERVLELLLFRHNTRKGILHILFLCRRLRRRRILPVIICSPHLSFLSILRLLMVSIESNEI